MRELRNSYLSIFGWGVFLASALSLGSCSSDETIDAIQGEAITFGNAFVENSTRAAEDPSYNNTNKLISQFNVWGTVTGNKDNTINVFNGASVTRGDKAYGEAWTCDQTQYWIPDATYKFMAIAHGTVASSDANKMPLTISYSADGETDLLLGELASNGIKTVTTDGAAVPEIGVTEGKVVNFTMSHLLSKVVFTFVNTDADIALKVKEIKLTGTSTSGTYTIATGKWNDTDTNYELGFGNEVTIAKGGNGTSELERLVIPGTYTNLGVTFKVNDEGNVGEEQSITATIKGDQTFVAGQSYNITANIKSGMKEIIFNVTSAAWDETVDDEINIQ